VSALIPSLFYEPKSQKSSNVGILFHYAFPKPMYAPKKYLPIVDVKLLFFQHCNHNSSQNDNKGEASAVARH
jgi:hypothetical protein